MPEAMRPYPEDAVIFLAVLALATEVDIFCSGIRQNSCPSNELQDFCKVHYVLIPLSIITLSPKGFKPLAGGLEPTCSMGSQPVDSSKPNVTNGDTHGPDENDETTLTGRGPMLLTYSKA